MPMRDFFMESITNMITNAVDRSHWMMDSEIDMLHKSNVMEIHGGISPSLLILFQEEGGLFAASMFKVSSFKAELLLDLGDQVGDVRGGGHLHASGTRKVDVVERDA